MPTPLLPANELGFLQKFMLRLRDAATLQLLDDEQEWSAFSKPDTAREGCWESNVVIEGMHCAACALTIEDALKGVPGEACACGVGLLLHATAVRGAAVMHAAAWWQGGVGGSGAGSVAPGSW